MVLFNYSTKELTAKIVYYGPGLCGKTTNLQYIHANLPGNIKGKMLSLATKTDRTLFFDFLPLDLGMIRGMKTRIQLYTVPGQVFYNETRKLVLKGADGIVFVADSQETMAGANVEAFKNLDENLRFHGLNLSEMPHVIQFNKRDLPRLSGIEEMNSAINRFNAPFYESVATNGIGVQDTLKAITKLVLLHLTTKYDPKTRKSPAPEPVASKAAAPSESPPEKTPAVEIPPQPEVSIPVAAAPDSGADDPGVPLSPMDGPMGTPEAGLPLSVPVPEETGTELPPSMTVPESPDLGAEEEARQDITPEFADSDIDELVGEVGEREFFEETAAEEPVLLEPEQDSGPVEEPAVDLPSFPVEPDPIDTPEEIQVDMTSFQAEETEEALPIQAPEMPRQEATPLLGSDFEVDRGFDPEWPSSPPEPSFPVEPQPTEENDLPAGEPLELAMDTEDAAGTEYTVRLTDVVENDGPQTGPKMEPVRLAPGSGTEITLPVELDTVDGLKRYWLHLNLRLDKVD